MNLDRNGIFKCKNKLFRKQVWECYVNAYKHDLFSPDEISRINWRKRLDLVRYAYKNISAYKQLYDKARVDVNGLRDEDDWERVPGIDKEFLRQFFKQSGEKLSKSSSARQSTTGGSTGEPLIVYRDTRFPEEILQWRLLRRWKVGLGCNRGMLWRFTNMESSWIQNQLNRIIWWPTKRIKLNASVITNADLERFAVEIRRSKAAMLWGYVGAIEKFAKYTEDNNLYFPELRLIWTTASPMPFNIRLYLENVFKVSVMDQYACSEIHFVGANCPKCINLHLDYDYRHVDIVDDNGSSVKDGEAGNVLLTDLHNYIFPLIKYKVGDRAKFVSRTGTCGLPYPVIGPVYGRVTDNVITKSGIIINGEYLTTIFDSHFKEIRKFQIYQAKNFDLLVTIVPQDNVDKSEVEIICRKVIGQIQEATSDSLKITLKIVDSIPDNRGKNRFVISELI